MCIILIQMPNGISLQMQDLFFSNYFFFLLQELFVPDLSGQNKTFSTLSALQSQWQACGWQLCLKLLYFSFSKLSDMLDIYHPLHSQ